MKKLKSIHQKSIRHELISPLIIAFIAATTLIVLLVFNDSQKLVRQMLESMRTEMIILVQHDLYDKLEEAIQLNQINENAYKSGILDVDDEANRERYFAGVLKEFDNVAMCYIGLPSGEFYGARRNIDGTYNIVRNNESTGGNSEYYAIDEFGNSLERTQVFENFDPRVRPWYIAAMETKALTFSSIYSHFVFKEPTLTASLPIYEGDELVGVLGIDFLMTWLSTTLEDLPIGENGQVFIIDEKGQLVATTTGESIFKLVDEKSQNILANESTNAVTQKVMTLSSDRLEKVLPEVDIDGKTYLVGKDQLDFYGIHWQIYTVIMEDDFFGEIKVTLIWTLVGVVIIAVLFILLVILVARRIIRPIQRLNESAKKLTQGVCETVPLERNHDELYELTQNFNEMGRRIVNHVEELATEVKLRTIELQEKNEILNRLSYIDELMQIANRRKFDEFFEQALELASRNDRPIGLMMLDIDNFKNFNDVYGHIAGDECLREIGKTLKRCIQRKSDLVARYGGEEMVVVVQETTLEGLLKVAEDIRREINGLGISHQKSEWAVVTVSIGTVFGKVKAKQTIDEIVGLADSVLYEAKANGKNRVEYKLM